ncbi:MAG: signal peptidase I [Bacilli bacterium]|nr:signal peptidase I [Bacilli bacterium]MBQ7240987.1 signal peptidase I [Bacilli bacterium]
MKIIKKIINVLTTLIIVVGGIFLVLYLFGIVPYVILSGSMEPTIKTGSLCFINKKVDVQEIKKKDVIAFKLDDGTLVTHRVDKINKDGIITKGDNNKRVDDGVVTANNYVGKNIFWIPKVGYVVMAFQSTRGKIVLITCVVLLFVVGMLFGDDTKKKKNKIAC